MDPKEARRHARIKLGGVEQTKEGVRAARGTRWLEDLGRDLRYAARTLLRRPGFTITAILTVALGTGATTALFTAVDGLMLRPLPLHEPDRLVELSAERSLGSGTFSHAQYEALGGVARTLAGVAALDEDRIVLDAGGAPEEVATGFVSGEYFQLLGVRTARGRTLLPSDDRQGAPTAGVVLSHRFWRARFAADPSVVGRTIRLNGEPVAVLGVLEEAFGDVSLDPLPSVWAPLALRDRVVPDADTYDATRFSLDVIARVRDGVSDAAAREELAALAARINDLAPVPAPAAITAIEAQRPRRVSGDDRDSLVRSFTLLGVATLLVLLIASTNVSGMLLARATGLRREIAIRTAIGAERGRLVRQLATEGLLLFVVGGAAGVVIAVWLTDLLEMFRWPDPVRLNIAADHTVLAFAFAVSVGAGLVFSAVPALHATRVGSAESLRLGEHRGARRSTWLRRALVVGQVAMSVVLLVSAGLFLRTLRHAFTFDTGFTPDRVWTAPVDAGRQRYGRAQARALYDGVLDAVRGVSGVESATLATAAPLGAGATDLVRIRPGTPVAAGDLEVRAYMVDSAFFRTLGIPILRGRALGGAARPGGVREALVNESLARSLSPDGRVLGTRIDRTFSAQLMVAGRADEAQAPYEIVGVVPDGRYRALRDDPEPLLFTSLAQDHRSRVVLAVRVRDGADEPTVAAIVRDVVHTVDPALPRLALTSIRGEIENAFLTQRIGAALTSLFAVLGLVLSIVGLYGVMAYTVASRAREIGVRIALGADARRVLRETVARGLVLAGTGLALGLALAFGASRLLTGMLFGIAPLDSVSFALAAVLLLASALCATWVPARRAARVDPLESIRAE